MSPPILLRAQAVASRVSRLPKSERASIEIAEPATEKQIAAHERKLRAAMPSSLRAYLLGTPGFVLRWAGAGSRYGSAFLTSKHVLQAESRRREWIDGYLDDPQDPAHRRWQAAFGLVHVANGDIIALEPEGNVVYLDHEGGGSHIVPLAPSLDTFLDAWSRVAFFGPEEWMLEPYLGPEGLVDGETARALRAELGLTLEETAVDYTPRRTFASDTWLRHPRFGLAYVTESNEASLSALFEDGAPRRLVHGRQG